MRYVNVTLLYYDQEMIDEIRERDVALLCYAFLRLTSLTDRQTGPPATISVTCCVFFQVDQLQLLTCHRHLST